MSSWPVGEPTKGFLAQLQDYDDRLRVVWDHRDDYWRLERKVRVGSKIAFFDRSNPCDRRAAEEGYVLVMRVPADCLDQQVFHALWTHDIQRRGGAKRVAQEIEEHEAAQAAASAAAASDAFAQRAKERWDGWNTNYPRTKFGRSAHTRGANLPGSRG